MVVEPDDLKATLPVVSEIEVNMTDEERAHMKKRILAECQLVIDAYWNAMVVLGYSQTEAKKVKDQVTTEWLKLTGF